jgi:hypothetical protein
MIKKLGMNFKIDTGQESILQIMKDTLDLIILEKGHMQKQKK